MVNADGQTDITKLTVVFRYFAKVPNLTRDTRLNSVGENGSRIISLSGEPICLRPVLKGPYTAEPRNSTLASKQMMTHLLTAIGLTPGGSSTVHIYTQTIHRTTK
jgi:hypothetical protein